MPDRLPVVLAIDDELDMLETYRSILLKKFLILTASSGAEALEILAQNQVNLVLLDVRMPKMSGLTLLKKLRELDNDLGVIMVTASKEVSAAVEAMKLGAFDYITKPFEVAELLVIIDQGLKKQALEKENLYLKESLKEATTYCDLIGRSPAMKKLFLTIEKIAPTDSTILINGESGTGKELVARAIHQKSRRANQPFIAVNCAAIPDNLLESELFGHERGSFTGALERKLGKFELADGGSLFLDEIGCMPPAMQAKLLRVLEDKKIERLGGEKTLPVNVRIIAATNVDFKQAIAEGKFRSDLFYRLNVIPVSLTPLRERLEDLDPLIAYFINRFNKELNKQVKGFSAKALAAMIKYSWPGNVRELQNLVERGMVLASQAEIDTDDLPLGLDDQAKNSLKNNLQEQEKEIIQQALKKCEYNRTKAAALLGIARSSLNSRISTLGLS